MDQRTIDDRILKREMMIEYFNMIDLPPAPFKINVCTTVLDAQKFRDAQLRAIKNQDVASRYWMNSYYRLYELKKYIENLKKNAV